MARKKVNLQLIANESVRRSTFKKRRKGLLKKVSELSTLCGVTASAVVYCPWDPKPEAWPSLANSTEVFTNFRAMPQLEQKRKMMDQEGLMHSRLTKMQEQLRRHERDNHELEISYVMHQAAVGCRHNLSGLSMKELTSISWMAETRIKAIKDRMSLLRSETQMSVPMPQMIPYEPLAEVVRSSPLSAMQVEPAAAMSVPEVPFMAGMAEKMRLTFRMEGVLWQGLHMQPAGNPGDAMFYHGGEEEQMMQLFPDAGFGVHDPLIPPPM